MNDKTLGLYKKFDVRRTDGSSEPGGKHHGCDYFVLDVAHDKPSSLDRTKLIEITKISDAWRVYIDLDTGGVHDGAVYAAQLQKDIEARRRES